MSAYPTSDPLYEPMLGANIDNSGTKHNFSFTTEFRYWFVYEGDEVLTFNGDDDLYVFIDGFRCLDVSGIHEPRSATLNFANPAADNQQQAIVQACKNRLEVGKPYEVVIFHAERHWFKSSFELTLSGFVSQRSECSPICGDGIVTRFERCDEGNGNNTGGYNECNATCDGFGASCGDGVLQPEYEECDDGEDENVGAYGGCAADCTFSQLCGDGVRQPEAGEQCDAGVNNGQPGSGCTSDCRYILE
ncbi:MAG: fibro-slime domain-containing protein [Polyangiales bacterium]